MVIGSISAKITSAPQNLGAFASATKEIGEVITFITGSNTQSQHR